jgi:hypothetical protein
LGTKRVRLANLSPEVPDSLIRIMRSRFGDVREVLAETWSTAYRYPVANEIRIVVITLRSMCHRLSWWRHTQRLSLMKGCLRHAADVTKRDMNTRTVPDGGEERKWKGRPPTWAEVSLMGRGPNRGGRRIDWVRRIRPAWRR